MSPPVHSYARRFPVSENLFRLRGRTSTYPVDLVQIIRLQHDAADNALPGSGLHLDFGRPEEEVKAGLDRRGVTLFGDGELDPVGAVRNAPAHGLPVGRGALGEVGVGILTVEAGIAGAICSGLAASLRDDGDRIWVQRTGLGQRIAGGVGLGSAEGQRCGEQQRRGECRERTHGGWQTDRERQNFTEWLTDVVVDSNLRF